MAHAQGPLPRPANVADANGANLGGVLVTRNAGAAYYPIGWVAYPNCLAVTRRVGLAEAGAFVDVAIWGQTRHVITRLTPGTRYAFIVATDVPHYKPPRWSDWAALDLNVDTPLCPAAALAFPADATVANQTISVETVSSAHLRRPPAGQVDNLVGRRSARRCEFAAARVISRSAT